MAAVIGGGARSRAPFGVLLRFEREPESQFGSGGIDDCDHFHGEIVRHDRAFNRA